jgi:hypothetical protein
VALGEAVRFVSAQTPAEYYRPIQVGAPGQTGVPAIAPAAAPGQPPAPAKLLAPAGGPSTLVPAGPAVAPPSRESGGPAAAGTGTSSIKQRLMELEDLKKAGLITEGEYRQKRERILKDL